MVTRGGLTFLLVLGLLGGARAQPAPSPTTLTLQLEGLRNTKGLVRVALFRSADGFPSDGARAAKALSLKPAGASMTVRFDALASGTWAVAVLHDENQNGRLDTNFLGIPVEGVAASNDAARRGPPKFQDAQVTVPPGESVLTVRMRYWM